MYLLRHSHDHHYFDILHDSVSSMQSLIAQQLSAGCITNSVCLVAKAREGSEDKKSTLTLKSLSTIIPPTRHPSPVNFPQCNV